MSSFNIPNNAIFTLTVSLDEKVTTWVFDDHDEFLAAHGFATQAASEGLRIIHATSPHGDYDMICDATEFCAWAIDTRGESHE